MGNYAFALLSITVSLSLLTFLPGSASASDAFLLGLAEDTWNYLKSDWATENSMPCSWRSSSMSGGDYANPAEIGFYMLSWIGAYEMRQTWSPGWSETESQVSSTLDRLEIWQSGLQPLYGPHSYNNSVFYRAYWVGWNPPRVGAGSYDHEVPSIDNAWLAASLITIEEYARAHGSASLQSKAHNILKDMDFSLWYHPGAHKFSWGAYNDPQGGGYCDYYSNENRITNFIARALGAINASEFRSSMAALSQGSASYGGITVDKVNWDGSYFTYAAPPLFIRENGTAYGKGTTDAATRAQMLYASDMGYPVWGISDCFDSLSGGYVLRGAPPRGSGSPATDPDTGLITPHASALALVTSYAGQASTNLQTMAALYPSAYNASYGFLDSIQLPSGQASYRFSALDQEWIFLSLMNHFNSTIWKHFYMNGNVSRAHTQMFNISPPSYPANYITVCKSGLCNFNTIQAAIDASASGKVVFVADSGTYIERLDFGGFLGRNNVTLDCNGAAIKGKGNETGIYMSKGHGCTVKGCKVSGFSYGMYSWDGSYHRFFNNTVTNSSYGFYITDTIYTTLAGNNASLNGYGIYVYWFGGGHVIEGNAAENNRNAGIAVSWGPSMSVIRNNTVKGNGRGISSECPYSHPANANNYTGNRAFGNGYGLHLCLSSNNTINSNIITGNTAGIYLSYGSGNRVFNNMLNNSANTELPSCSYANAWNTTLKPGSNIAGGSLIGGNLWLSPSGSGFSESCADSDCNGICNASYIICANNADMHPLKRSRAQSLDGDVNGDCIVNIFDMAAVGIAFGSRTGEPGWNARADMNADGLINIFDLAFVGLSFGNAC